MTDECVISSLQACNFNPIEHNMDSHKQVNQYLMILPRSQRKIHSAHSLAIGTTSFLPDTFPFRSISKPSKIPSNLPGRICIGQALSFPLSIKPCRSWYHARAQTPISGRGGIPYGSGSSTPRPEMAPPITNSCLTVLREQRLSWYCSNAQYFPPVLPMAA